MAVRRAAAAAAAAAGFLSARSKALPHGCRPASLPQPAAPPPSPPLPPPLLKRLHQHLVRGGDGGVVLQRGPQLGQPLLLALVERKVGGDRGALLVRQPPRALVAHPAVQAAPPREDEEDVLEPKVLAQAAVQDLDGRGHERPAAVADVAAAAAGADVVIVCEVDVKHELALHGGEAGGVGGAALRVDVVDGADVDLGGAPVLDRSLHLRQVLRARRGGGWGARGAAAPGVSAPLRAGCVNPGWAAALRNLDPCWGPAGHPLTDRASQPRPPSPCCLP